jgi:cysteinyl-tRNA synthetase
MPLILHNTLTRKPEPFVPADPARVTFYTCGPTVYDDAHIGNFRSFLAADLLRRWIESPLCELARPDGTVHKGPRRVTHVMNVTDVGHMTDDDAADGGGEDKMEAATRRLAQAKKSGTARELETLDPRDPYAIASFYAERFMQDARKLGLKVAIEAAKDPSLMPRATDNVTGMIAMIDRLVENGFAYQAGDAVYFDVQQFAPYGQLSGNTLDELRGGAGGRVSDEHQDQKRHPADFLLWKADDSHTMKWDSPWGTGYPGWHIECSVMSLGRLIPGGLDRVLGDGSGEITIDLHSGGEDNIFPHHECERAQSCACTGGDRFSRHWFHGRFLMVEGEKMSKSSGNFFTARDLFVKGHEPAAVRLELIKTHYRVNANFTEQGLKDSARMIERWRKIGDAGASSAEAGEQPGTFLADFAAAMHDDLNIAGAIGALNAWTGSIDSPTRADAEAMQLVEKVLGVLSLERATATQTDIGVFVGVEPSPDVEALLAERRDSKKAKDFARADAIRDQLTAQGLSIKDVAGGKVEVSKS